MNLRSLFVNCAMVAVIALSAENSGFCGEWGFGIENKEGAEWRLSDDGILTISGKGAIMDCNPAKGLSGGFSPISSAIRNLSSVSVIFEDDITSIGSYFFFHLDGMKDKYDLAQMPSSGNYDPRSNDSFKSITSVKLNSTLCWIGDFAFYGCSNLTEIDFEKPTTLRIGPRAFGKTSIKKMFIPDNVILETTSLVRCPLEQVIITNPEPSTEKAYIGEYKPSDARYDKFYKDPDVTTVTDVYVPDVEAYAKWEPMPKPMLKEGKYSLEDAKLGNITIACNIPGYEASTNYQFDQLTEGRHTVSIPVKFTGEREFETTVKYTYTVGDASTSINNIEGDGFSVKISDGMIVVSGNSEPIVIFNITGQKVYEGAENRIQLPSGIYFVNCGGKTIKTKL